MLLLTSYPQYDGGGWFQWGRSVFPSKSSKKTGACPSAGAEHANSASSGKSAIKYLVKHRGKFHLHYMRSQTETVPPTGECACYPLYMNCWPGQQFSLQSPGSLSG